MSPTRLHVCKGVEITCHVPDDEAERLKANTPALDPVTGDTVGTGDARLAKDELQVAVVSED